jgi:predicted permease
MIFNSILPVILLLALGFLLRRGKFFSEHFAKGMSQLVYWVGLPALLVGKLSNAQYEFETLRNVLVVFFGAMFAVLVIGWAVSILMGMPKRSRGAFVQAGFRGNLGYLGLPIVLFSISGQDPTYATELTSLAVLLLAPGSLVHNVASVFVLVANEERETKVGDDENETENLKRQSNFHRIFWSLISNPLIIAVLIGIGFGTMSDQVRLPMFLERTLTSLGQMSVPMALLAVGASFTKFKLPGSPVQTGVATALKIVVAPLIGLLLAWLVGLSAMEARVVLVYLATPTAVASYILVEQFRGDDGLAASVVVVSTLLSMVSLSVALWMTTESVWEVWFV